MRQPFFVAMALAAAATSARAQTVGLPSRLPLFVLQGGDTPNTNPHFSEPSQAFGVDFGVVGGFRSLTKIRDAKHVEDFYCWDTEVVSPTDGKVVEADNTLPDNPLGTKDATHPLGNHVVIQTGNRFLYVAHLRQNTVTVKAGDSVTRGQIIGHCGNSGNTDFPHIHVHATPSPHFGEMHGMNLIYGPMHVSLNGKDFDNVEWPLLAGLWVRVP